jgi:hypothetical protein
VSVLGVASDMRAPSLVGVDAHSAATTSGFPLSTT